MKEFEIYRVTGHYKQPRMYGGQKLKVDLKATIIKDDDIATTIKAPDFYGDIHEHIFCKPYKLKWKKLN